LHILSQRIGEGKMKIGDLVRWSDSELLWHVVNWDYALSGSDISMVRRRGIILDKNPKYFFVLWENDDKRAHATSDLEVVSESR
jgi:hypothetical protein